MLNRGQAYFDSLRTFVRFFDIKSAALFHFLH